MFDGIIESEYPSCDIIQECGLVNCIDIELIDDVNVEGVQEFEVEIVSVSLGSIGVPGATEVVINDTIGR